MSAASRRKPSLPVRFYLVAFAVAVAIPIVVFAAFLLVRFAEAERAGFERTATRVARQAAQMSDGELASLLNAMRGLAASANLESGNLGEFYAEATRFIGDREEIVLLREFAPRQVLNTQRPFGEALPPAIPLAPDEEAAVRAGLHHISNTFLSPISGEPRVAIVMPVRSAGRDLLLAVTVPTTRFRDLIVEAAPPDWLVGVGDRAGNFVTRSERHDEVSGRPGVSQYVAMAEGPAGTFVARNLDGDEVLAGYVRSDLSGWLFAANIPMQVVQAPLQQTLLSIGLFGALSVLLSVVLALWFGARFDMQTRALVDRALALGGARPMAPLSGAIREFDVIAEAFSSADEALRRRSREFEAVLSTVPAGVWFTYDRTVGRVSRNRYAAELMRLPAGDGIALDTVTGLPQSVRMARGQRDLRPEELPLQRALAGEQVTDDEYVFKYDDGTSRVVLISAQAIRNQQEAVVGAVAVGLDITERKRSEEQRRLLVNELNHRVKNTLAIVQSIVMQTLRATPEPAQAHEALQSRLVALAGAHDVLNRESWEGAALQDVATAALAPHPGSGQVRVEGPSVWLPPSFAMSLTLILHELATNATKYGALKIPAGQVDLNWGVKEAGPGKLHLTVRWAEEGGPTVEEPQRQGFGSRLISRLMAAEEEGSSVIDYTRRGVTCTLRAVIPVRAPSDNRPKFEVTKV